MAISIGDAVLKLGVDKKDFDRSMSGIAKSVGEHRKKIGVAMTAMGAVIVGSLGLALKSSVDFESSMREVNTMMGLSQKEFKEFSKEVQDLAADLGVDAVESAKALYQAISAGVPKDNVLEFLEIASKAAIGGITSTEIAVDGLTTVINAFKLPLTETQEVADIMFQTVKGGKTTFEELSASMFQVAPIAAASGIEFREIAAALATMTKQGVPTTIATTQLRQAMVALQKPTIEMNAAITELGYESGQAMLAELGFADSLTLLRDSTKGSNEDLLKMFGSVEAGGAVLALTGENAQVFKDDLDAMANSTGAATGAFEEMELSASRQMASLKSAFQDVAISVGNVLLPILKDIIDRIKPIITAIKDWADSHPGLIKVIVIATGVLGGLMLVLGPLLFILPQITMAFGLMKGAIAKSTVAMAAHNISALALTGVLAGLAVGVGLLTFGLTKLFAIQNRNAQRRAFNMRLEEERVKLINGEANAYMEVAKEIVAFGDALGSLSEEESKQIEILRNWINETEAMNEAAKEAAEAVEEITEAVEESTDSYRAYDIMINQYLLALDGQNNALAQAIDNLIEFRGGWDNLTDATKKQITMMREYVLELEIIQARQLEVYDSWLRWVREIEPSVVEFDRFGLSVEDVVKFLANQWNMTTSEVIAKLQSMDIAVEDVRYKLGDLGITAFEVAAFMALLTGEYEEFLRVISGGDLTPLPDIISWEDWFEKLGLADFGITIEQYIEMAHRLQEAIAALGGEGLHGQAAVEEFLKGVFGADWEFWAWALGFLGLAMSGGDPGSPPAGGPGSESANPPGLAGGAMINEPTLLTSLRTMSPVGIAGEAGPERLLGVAATRAGAGTVNIIVELDGEVLAQALGEPLVDEIRLRTGGHI